MMKELRIDFPDYSADSQERDAQRYERRSKKDIYIMRVDGVWGAFMPRDKCSISLAGKQGQELASFILEAQDFFTEELKIKPNFHCVLNRGIEHHLRQHIIAHNLLKDR